MYEKIKRIIDLTIAIIALLILFVPMVMIGIIIKLTSKGPVIHWSKRVGKDNNIFEMAKFRTMRIDTPQVATHLMTNPGSFVTGIGKFLRKYSLDELPQFWNVIVGDLSIVGPRPALYNQDDLVALRTEKGIHKLKVGITGWAQVNGRDELPIPVKVEYDYQYMQKRSLYYDFKILLLTFVKVFKSEGVSH